MKVKSAENRAEQPEQRLSVQLNGFIPNASVSVVHFLLTPFVTPPVRGTRCDGASKRGGTARLSHCFLVDTHQAQSRLRKRMIPAGKTYARPFLARWVAMVEDNLPPVCPFASDKSVAN